MGRGSLPGGRVRLGVNYLAVAAIFFPVFFAACFFTCFLAGLVAGPAAWRVDAPAVFCAVNAAGVAANVKPEQIRPAVRHRAVMLDFMEVLWVRSLNLWLLRWFATN